jgi:sugar phosphate permease
MKPRIHYAWVIAGLTFVVLLVTAGLRSTPGLLMIPLEAEFGWSRALISTAAALNILLFGLIGPFAAGLMDRIGLRRAITGALVLLSVSVFATTQMRTPWQLLLLWGVLVGIGTSGTSMVLSAVIANRWFYERRGLIVGFLSASFATGQLIFLPLMARLLEHSGWRMVSVAVATGAALVAMLVWWGMRDSPASMGLLPYGATADLPKPPPPLAPIAALKVASRKPVFWLLAGTFFVCGASTNGLIGTHLIPACHDSGIPEMRAAGLLALMGLFDIMGTTASGWLTDRLSPRLLLCIYYGLRGLSLLLLPVLLAQGNSPFLNLFALFYGLDWIATVPPTVRIAADSFGRQNAGVIYGWISAAHQVGASMAAFGAGVIRTQTGNYRPAFYIAAALCMVAAASFVVNRVRRAPLPLPATGA